MNNEVTGSSLLNIEYLHEPIIDTDPEILFMRLIIGKKLGRSNTQITIERTNEKDVY
jgi:hypothetical protein